MPLEQLDPDTVELTIASKKGLLRACPFCGSDALMGSAVNPSSAFSSSPIYQSRIFCTNYRCNSSLVANERNRDDAQRSAIEQWNKRAPSCALPGKPASAKPIAWMRPSDGAILHDSSKDMCDFRRREWTPLGIVPRPDTTDAQ